MKSLEFTVLCNEQHPELRYEAIFLGFHSRDQKCHSVKKKSWQKQRQEDRVIYTCTSHCLPHAHSSVLIYPSSCFLDGSIKSYNREIILNLINGLQFGQLLEPLSRTAPLSGGQAACEFPREPLRVYETGFIVERRPGGS